VPKNTVISSGLLLANTQVGILNTLRVLLDGNEIQEEKPIDYYTRIQPFRTVKGGSHKESGFLPIVNFALSSPNDQPNGSVNASRVRLFQVDLNIWNLPVNPQYVYNFIIYGETLNFFVVESGYGGLKYSL
jgi:hypothetical protein